MKLKDSLISAIFVGRPNRFITIININGKEFESHLPDPGRLKELLIVGCKLWVKYENNSNRRTRYDTVFVEHNGQLVSLISTLPNVFVKESLNKNTLPVYKNYKLIKPEVQFKITGLTFYLRIRTAALFYLEVKSVTCVKNGVAKFPDAITRRGLLHLKLLGELVSHLVTKQEFFLSANVKMHIFSTNVGKRSTFFICFSRSLLYWSKINCITLNISKTEITFNEEISINLAKRN